MAYRYLIGGVRGNTLRLHHHLKNSNKTVGLFGLISSSNNDGGNPQQRLLCSAVAPSSAFPIATRRRITVYDYYCAAIRRLGYSLVKDAREKEETMNLAKFAVNKHNENENEHLQFVSVVRAYRVNVSWFAYSILLEATDGNAAGEKKLYRATVSKDGLPNSVDLLIWEPVDHPSENWPPSKGLISSNDHNHNHGRFVGSTFAPSTPSPNTTTPDYNIRRSEDVSEGIAANYTHPSQGHSNLIGATNIGGVEVDDAHTNDMIINLAKFAVNKRNESENEHLQFVRVVGAYSKLVGGFLYYIVLEAIDGDAGEKKFYRAIVWEQPWLDSLELTAWELVDDPSAFQPGMNKAWDVELDHKEYLCTKCKMTVV